MKEMKSGRGEGKGRNCMVRIIFCSIKCAFERGRGKEKRGGVIGREIKHYAPGKGKKKKNINAEGGEEMRPLLFLSFLATGVERESHDRWFASSVAKRKGERWTSQERGKGEIRCSR